ncbi:tRNA uridine(34) 5-carboxymethylaminomethyl modification radical SAM/GNAT enzyme Elp3 [Candidatus Woesearchaeota archaeon]|nr:tRNA uridine(34) 5-carboxymethylaminomethyl modification radical SAM/GNAT enzyme Elp3 [Candidatus Woesearchaeota archaeon]
MQEYYEELIREIINKKLNLAQALKLRRYLAREYKPETFPSIIQILTHADNKQVTKLKHLITKPARTSSGVSVVAIMTKPMKCPHGKCVTCPGGVNSYFGDVPQSYTGREPATMRAIRNHYDPYAQVFNRLQQYVLMDRTPDKAELIIMGGTFPSFPEEYQEEFVKYSFKALNDFGKMFYNKDKLQFDKFKKFFELPGDMDDEAREKKIRDKVSKLRMECSLDKEQEKNEKSKLRCVALCVETRPDYSSEKEINQMLGLGTTRVELGIQSVYDGVLRRIDRGHSVADTIEATMLLKDSFLKVGYHVMPGLPNSSRENDIEMFKELFSNQDFKPDALKIYPCMVLKGTKLYEQWLRGEYEPLTTEEAADIISEGKRHVPRFCRILRVQRDIPTKVTEAGAGITNLRQKVHEEMIKKGIKCDCIRCREPKDRIAILENAKLLRYDYQASGGKEVFLSFEDVKNDVILGFCRLRKPYKPFRKEITYNSAGIRELHVYGESTPIGKKGAVQHKGYGKKLLQEAERIAEKEFDAKKILVISGVGVREYYKKQGYKRDGAYMSKKL